MHEKTTASNHSWSSSRWLVKASSKEGSPQKKTYSDFNRALECLKAIGTNHSCYYSSCSGLGSRAYENKKIYIFKFIKIKISKKGFNRKIRQLYRTCQSEVSFPFCYMMEKNDEGVLTIFMNGHLYKTIVYITTHQNEKKRWLRGLTGYNAVLYSRVPMMHCIGLWFLITLLVQYVVTLIFRGIDKGKGKKYVYDGSCVRQLRIVHPIKLE